MSRERVVRNVNRSARFRSRADKEWVCIGWRVVDGATGGAQQGARSTGSFGEPHQMSTPAIGYGAVDRTCAEAPQLCY
jgi:hypothetical protein